MVCVYDVFRHCKSLADSSRLLEAFLVEVLILPTLVLRPAVLHRDAHLPGTAKLSNALSSLCYQTTVSVYLNCESMEAVAASEAGPRLACR